jgi:hypothetical protein
MNTRPAMNTCFLPATLCFLSTLALVSVLSGGVMPAQAQTWVQLTPGAGSAPAARAWSSAVFDAQNRRMIVFAGRAGSDFGDIWAFDLAAHTWTDLTPSTGSAPAARRTPGSGYDPVGHRMVTWSGQAPGTFFNDAWSFDLGTNTWTLLTPAGGPPNIRYGVAAAYDPTAGELVTFACFTNMGRFDDTWRLDPALQAWTDVTPVSSPLERCLHAACYDAAGGRMIMYGGQNAGARDDIWAFDFSTDTWTDITPATRPDGRFFAAVVCDDANRRVTVFGGTTNSGMTNEVWGFDLWTEEWTQLFPSGTAPSAREGAAAVYDAAADRMVFFGGNDGSFLNEVWAIEDLSQMVTSTRRSAAPGLSLEQNVPNPFNPSTVIAWTVDRAGPVQLRVFGIRGDLVRTLVSGSTRAGEHSAVWDGRDDRGRRVSSGVYFYRLETPDAVRSHSMVLLK